MNKDLQAQHLRHELMNCLDWNDINNSDDLKACSLARQNLKLLPNSQKAQNLVKLTDKFEHLPAMVQPTDKVLILMGHIMQNIYLN